MAEVKFHPISQKFRTEDVDGYWVTVKVEENITKCEHQPHDLDIRVSWTEIPFRTGDSFSLAFTATADENDPCWYSIRWDGGFTRFYAVKWESLASEVYRWADAAHRKSRAAANG